MKKSFIDNNLIYPEKFADIFIDGEKSKYVISNRGYVISHQTDCKVILKNHVLESGYNVVCLYHNEKKHWKYIHRLVAEAFIPIPDEYLKQNLTYRDLEVNHIDGTHVGKSNNNIWNLEWNTSSDNKFHAYRTGLKKSCEDCPASSYSNKQIEKVCKLLEEGELGNREIWKMTGVSVTTIQSILSRTQWKDISIKYDFSKRKKRHILYSDKEKEVAIDLLRNSDLSLKDIGDIAGMTRNAVWALNKKHNIR